MKPYKILFAPSDNNATSGAFLSMVKLCQLLRKEFGHEILVVLRCNGTGEKLLKKNDIPYIKIHSFNWFVPYKPCTLKRKIKKLLCYIWMPATKIYNKIAVNKIAALIEKEKIDIVHLNTSCCYVAALAAQKCNKPYVWHIREFLEEDQERCIWDRPFANDLMKNARFVVTISDGIYQKYLRLLKSDNVVKILNGIDSDQFYKPNHKIFTDQHIKMLIVGSINKSKGQEQAVLACKKMIDAGIKDFELKIVGKDSEYARKLQKEVSDMKLTPYITFCGPRDDIQNFYEEADITFMCSEAEAFGRVTVEAMMSGSLVIGANAGGTAELVSDKETGLLYESGNPNSLAKQIIYAISNRQEMQRIADNGRIQMVSNMTALSNARMVHSLYQKITE